MRLLGLLLAFSLLGCGSTPTCVDSDRDGFGDNCEAGDDCDDTNPDRVNNCDFVPPPDCSADPVSTGCPCLIGSRGSCLEEPPAGVGICSAGSIRCVNGFWGRCEGGVAARFEQCNELDDDCDARVDEGVLSPCGGCNTSCSGGVWGEGPDPFVPVDGLEVTPRGELTLGRVEVRFGEVWVANSAEATLSRIDANTGDETARYPTGAPEPSRVAVDHRGDAWVISRAFDGVGRLTKVAGVRERCIDRDDDGLETSGGPTDVRPIDEDECVLLSVDVGEAGDVPRALAIDGDRGLDDVSGGDAWVGLHDGQAVVELSGLTGQELRRVETPSFAPYAATFDRWGTLWMISRDGKLARIDPRPETPEVEITEVPAVCFLLYGIAADELGRLLLSGFSCDRVFLYDPATDVWATRETAASPRGVVTTGRDARAWVAHTEGLISELSLEPFRVLRTIPLTGLDVSPFESIGIGVDGQDRVWVASSQGGDEGGEGVGVATRVDPKAGAVDRQVPVGAAPHVQGDLAGARVRSDLVAEASTTRIFEGCGDAGETDWRALHVAGSPGSSGRIALAVRAAETVAGLSEAEFEEVGVVPETPPPFELDLEDGGVIEVRLTLSVDGSVGPPRVQRIGVEWRCPGPD